jgi:hypothetical protein
MQPPQAHYLASTGVNHDVLASKFIAWDTGSTLVEAENALQRMEAEMQETWMASLLKESSWVETMTLASHASRTPEVQGHNSCAIRRLDFHMPMNGVGDNCTESTHASASDTAVCQFLAWDVDVGNSP